MCWPRAEPARHIVGLQCRLRQRSEARVIPQADSSSSLADLKWFEVFKDHQLQHLIRTAHSKNFDVRDAVARIDAADANAGIARADRLPSAGFTADATTMRFSRGGSFPVPEGFSQKRTFGSMAFNLLSFEADIWGRLRSTSDAAKAQVLAAEESRKAVMTTVVSEVATAYFTLLELDAQLEIAKRTLMTRENSLQIIQTRERRGLSTLLDVRQGEQLVQTAAQAIPVIEQSIEQTENQISLLLGESPGDIPRGLALTEQEEPPAVPAGLPSALLERRPDIKSAEQNLVAAGAMVDAAKAAYFPRISLTGFLGSQTTEFSSLFTGPTGVWQFVPQVTQPIFTGGRLRSNERLAKAEQQIAVVQYQRVIQTAFREVADALIQHRKSREIRAQQEVLFKTLQDRVRLAYRRYRGGVDTLLSALDADRDLFEAELRLTQSRRNELIAIVQLYRSLGGGWQL